jgi:hypothetical protein
VKRLRRTGLKLVAVLGVLALILFAYRTVAFRTAGVGLVATCHEGPAESIAFELQGSFTNEFHPPWNPAPWCLAGQAGGRSTGEGTGTIGNFEFVSDWCMVDGILIAEEESLSTETGDILLTERTATEGSPSPLEAILRTLLGPPLRFEGVFVISGGTGEFDGASGQANLVAEQLGGGRTAMAACGAIEYN